MHSKKQILEALIRKEKHLIKHCMVNDWLIAKEQHEALLEMYTEQLENLIAESTQTGHHFLSLLNDEQKLAFIDNYLDIYISRKDKQLAMFTLREFLDRKYENIIEFLGSAFEWTDAKEGSQYWADIVVNLILNNHGTV